MRRVHPARRASRSPSTLVNPTVVHDVLDLIARLGRPDRSRAEAAAARRRGCARASGPSRSAWRRCRGPRVLYVLWPDPLIVPARGALVSELIALAGARLGDRRRAATGYPRYSMEAAVARHARGHPAREPRRGQSADGAGQVGALHRRSPRSASGRLHTVDGDLLHRYGPRMVDGLEQLARLIHPEAFAGDRAPCASAGARLAAAAGLGVVRRGRRGGASSSAARRSRPAPCWPCSPGAGRRRGGPGRGAEPAAAAHRRRRSSPAAPSPWRARAFRA